MSDEDGSGVAEMGAGATALVGAVEATGGATVGATLAGGGVAAAGVAAASVLAAGAAGYAIGTGIEHATDGAISDGVSDGLMGLVGEEHSLAAAHAFDDGEILEGLGHMGAGAVSTIGDALGGAAETVSDFGSDLFDGAGDALGNAAETIGDVAGDAVDAVSDAAGTVADAAEEAWDSIDLNPFDGE
jgi:hypothetical protein